MTKTNQKDREKMRNYISAALMALAFLTSGDELWQIGLTAGLILEALAVQGHKKKPPSVREHRRRQTAEDDVINVQHNYTTAGEGRSNEKTTRFT